MPHKIGQTAKFTFEGKTFELETKTHHYAAAFIDCEKDRPTGWNIPSYFLLQAVRNSPQIDEFNLRSTSEYIQNPDKISARNGYVAGFYADSNGAGLDCRFPSYRNAFGVRYMREIPSTERK